MGYSVQDWQTIIECINDENAGLSEGEEISPLILTKETIGTREKIKVTQANNLTACVSQGIALSRVM